MKAIAALKPPQASPKRGRLASGSDPRRFAEHAVRSEMQMADPNRASLLAEQRRSLRVIRILTGPDGGLWKRLGDGIREVLREALRGMDVEVFLGAAISNIRKVENGEAEIGFANAASTLDALAGREPFAVPAQNLSHLATLTFQYFQIVALREAGIRSVPDLRGKRLAVEPPGSTAERLSQVLLQRHRLQYSDFAAVRHVSFVEAVTLLNTRQADAFAFINPAPAPVVQALMATGQAQLLSLQHGELAAMLAGHPGFSLGVIPAGAYPGLPDTPSLGNHTHLFVRRDLPHSFVYSITRALAKNLARFGMVAEDLQDHTVGKMARDIGIPPHSGALAYYEGAGRAA